jgi:ribonuclease HI
MGARAGLGVWWGDRGDAACRNLSERVPGDLQTNNRGEILVSSISGEPSLTVSLTDRSSQSVIRALETCPYPDIPIEIRTDSQYTINCKRAALPSGLT